MNYTVMSAPNTVGFIYSGNKLKLREASYKNVLNNGRKVVDNTPAAAISNNSLPNAKEISVSNIVTPSIGNVSKRIKDAEGLIGSVVYMTAGGKKPVKIKPVVVQAVARVGQSEFKKHEPIVQEAVIPNVEEAKVVEPASAIKDVKVNEAAYVGLESPTISMPTITEEVMNKAENQEVADLPEEPTVSIPVDAIKQASEASGIAQVQKEEPIISTPKAEMPKETKVMNFDEVRQMQEKLDEVGKATIEAKQRVTATQNKINSVVENTKTAETELEKLNKEQVATEEKSELLKKKTCEFLQKQMEVLEKKKTAYFEQLSSYETQLEQVQEKEKEVNAKKEAKEKEVEKAQADYDAWSELHKAITNKAAEFDSQLSYDDQEESKIISVKDLAADKAKDTSSEVTFNEDPVVLRKVA